MVPRRVTLDDPAVGDLGRNLRAAREKLGLTQEQLSDLSGVQAGEVSRIERGQRDPRVSTLERLAAAVEVEPGDLLRQENRVSKPHES
jgi:transcriptional regulator with XRE-family HTH domain